MDQDKQHGNAQTEILDEKRQEEIKAKFDRDSRTRHFTGIPGYIVKGLLVLFAAYVFATTLLFTLPEQVRRSAFVGILVFIGYLFYPARKGMTSRVNYIPWYDFVLAILGGGAFFYWVFNFHEIIHRAALITPTDIYVGLVGMILLAELCRRVVGVPILVVALGFVAFAFLDGYSLRRVVHQLFFTTEGIIGVPIGVASTFIVLFIFLASFLEKTGIAKFFIDLANGLAGSKSGGPAKVAVIASALLGLISGSSVANTVSSGPITIPTMKKIGYKPEFAAAVEASASTGGQIVPPILGAAAFLMAEITAIPYITIALAATLPAALYFIGVFLMVHFEAKKLGLKGLPKEMIPKVGLLALTKGYLFLPIILLVILMGRGFTPAFAACWAILAVFVLSFIRKDTRFKPGTFVEAVGNGTKNTISVAIACAVAGTIVGIVTLTGIGQILINQLVRVVNHPFFIATGTSLFVALLITAVTCIVIGLGMPTTAKYVIMATIAAPMIMRAGMEIGVVVPLLAAHMFVFYFGIVADITPPVALAAYAGAAIAKSNPIKTAVIATKLAIATFILPFIIVLSPAILIGYHDSTVLEIIKIIISSIIGMASLAVGVQGYMLTKVSAPFRLLAAAAGILMLYPGIGTDLIGAGMAGLVVVSQALIAKREKITV
ncbi:MAG: TRAP transporter fused permease subunit [Treponema sp.]|nr:TRAP transporter fused permease subunit [Treponema sp.]